MNEQRDSKIDECMVGRGTGKYVRFLSLKKYQEKLLNEGRI